MAATDRESIGAALGRIASGTFIVTAAQGERSTGFLASWVQQAGFEPPILTLAVKVGRPIATLLDAGAPFVVNVLGDGQTEVYRHFVRGFELDEPAFDGLATTVGETGGPIIADALAWLECRPYGKVPAGDHVVYLGEVVAGGGAGKVQPQIRLRRSGFNY